MTPSYLVTHSGGFHADELCSSAVLSHLFPQAMIKRSRDPAWITPDPDRIIYDVGGDYNAETGIFDHHQRNAPLRETGQPYSSFGLIWKHFGKAYVASLGVPETNQQEIVDRFDADFVLPIDLLDNGAIPPSTAKELTPLTLPSLLEALKPEFDTDEADADNAAFLRALAITKPLIQAQVMQLAAALRARSLVFDAIAKGGDSRILELPQGMPFRAALDAAGADHLLFVVHPRSQGDWSLGGIRVTEDSFDQRADLPAAWAGLTNDALEKISGVAGATFCHNGRFIAAASSREAILAMAKIAVQEAEARTQET